MAIMVMVQTIQRNYIIWIKYGGGENIYSLDNYRKICLGCKFFVECPGKQPGCEDYEEDIDEHMLGD